MVFTPTLDIAKGGEMTFTAYPRTREFFTRMWQAVLEQLEKTS